MNDIVSTRTRFPFLLGEEADSLDGLLMFEEQLGLAWDDAVDARTKFAYNLHMILEHKLFLHRTESVTENIGVLDGAATLSALPIKGTVKCKDTLSGKKISVSMDADIARPKGSPEEIGITYQYHIYPKQKDYLAYLRTRLGIGTSTAKQDHRALRTAKYLGFTTLEQMAEVGISNLVTVSNGFKVDPETGEPLDIKVGELPEGKSAVEYGRFVAGELAAKQNELSSSDFFRERERLLNPGRVQVRIERRENGSRTWVCELYKDDMLHFWTGEVIIDTDDMGMSLIFENDRVRNLIPDEVMDYVVERLRL